jgi:ASC-1-like (ASCH) protein
MDWLKALGYALLFVVLLLSALLLGRWSCCGMGAAAMGGSAYGGDDYCGGDDGDDYDMMGGGPFRLKVSDPEYTALLEGKKVVEARLDRPPFANLKEGEEIVVIRSRPKDDTSEYPGGKYKHNSKIVKITKYSSLEELLKKETLAKVYPGKTAAEAAARFGMYLPPGTSAKDPVLAIELKIKK